jgi:hypothetical protein
LHQFGDRDHRGAPLALVRASRASFLYTGPDRGVEHEGVLGRRAREGMACFSCWSLEECGSSLAPLSPTSWIDLLRGFVYTDELREERGSYGEIKPLFDSWVA